MMVADVSVGEGVEITGGRIPAIIEQKFGLSG